MKHTVVALLLLVLLALAGTSAFAVTSMILGDEELCVYEGRPLNEIRLYGKTKLFLPSYADADAAKAVFSSVKGLKVYQSAGVPTLYLQTKSGKTTSIEKSKLNSETGAYLLVDVDGTVLDMGSLDMIKCHGNSTMQPDKKPFKIKLSEKKALLGMNKLSKWILLANQYDQTAIHNTVCLKLAAAAGLPYTPQCRAVDLYINGNYRGNYLLVEKIEISKNMLPITDLEKETEAVNDAPLDSYPYARGTSDLLGSGAFTVTKTFSAKRNLPGWKKMNGGDWTARDVPNDPEDITGGYLIEVANETNGDTTAHFVCSSSGWRIFFRSPKEASVAQVRYIMGILERLDRAIDQKDFATLSQIIDVDEWASRYVLEEFVGNYDGGTGSFYMYKDVDSVDPLLHCGPVWDYDTTLGAKKAVSNASAILLGHADTAFVKNSFAVFYRMTEIPEFMERVKAIYAKTYRPLIRVLLGQETMADGSLLSIREESAAISASYAMNYERWDYELHMRFVNPGFDEKSGLEYMVDWVEKRMAYLDSVWLSPEEK